MTTEPTDERRAALLPCPFCGGEADDNMPTDGSTWRYVVCLDCKASSALAPTLAEQHALWNRRAALSRTGDTPADTRSAVIEIVSCLREAVQWVEHDEGGLFHKRCEAAICALDKSRVKC